MASFLIILSCIFIYLVRPATLASKSNQLCARVRAGTKLGLISVTFSSRPASIDFFTSQGSLFFRVPESGLKGHWIDAQDATEHNYATGLLSGIKSLNLAREPLMAYYFFELKRTLERKVGLVVTALKQYLIDMEPERQGARWASGKPWWSEETTPWWSGPRKETFTIVHDQRRQPKKEVYGQMISKDTYDGTLDFVMYQLWIEGDDDELRITSSMEKEGSPLGSNPLRHFYYLERNANSSQLLLVHRHNRNRRLGQPEAQMFTTLPRGFLYADKLYLFDETRRCVHIVDAFNRIDLAAKFRSEPKKDLLFHRTNVPYEVFFKCSQEGTNSSSKLGSKRCETNIYSKPVGEGDTDANGGNWISWLLLSAALCLLAFACFYTLIHTAECSSFWKSVRGKRKAANLPTPRTDGSIPAGTTWVLEDSSLFDSSSPQARDLLGTRGLDNMPSVELKKFKRSFGSTSTSTSLMSNASRGSAKPNPTKSPKVGSKTGAGKAKKTPKEAGTAGSTSPKSPKVASKSSPGSPLNGKSPRKSASSQMKPSQGSSTTKSQMSAKSTTL